MLNKQYYIVSNKHSDGYTRTFWGPDECGYTTNLELAGVYNEDIFESRPYPLVDESNIKYAWKYETYFIETSNVELLGKKITCIKI
jgi:hypothetical protein